MIRTEKINKLNYLAGIIDGEGALGIYTHKGGYVCYGLHMSVTNTNRELLDWIKDNFGGKVYNHYDRRPNNATSWAWHMNKNQQIYKMCKLILPYLIVKREICELVIEAWEDTFHWNYRGKSKSLPEYARKKRELYYHRTLELNKNGPKEESNMPVKLKKRLTLEEYT